MPRLLDTAILLTATVVIIAVLSTYISTTEDNTDLRYVFRLIIYPSLPCT